MPQLLLFRHAKSDWGDPHLGDFDRPLAKRGKNAAKAMGAYIQTRDLVPHRILVSTAARTLETLSIAAKQWKSQPEVIESRALYLASAQEMADQIHALGGKAERLMVIAHNPGTENLAWAACGVKPSGDAQGIAAMGQKFPTAALAVIGFSGTFWEAVDLQAGSLHSFKRPKDLADRT
ncbi:MAG: SixA phosphatase family protein [Magnetospiraceae bacterium]